MAEHREHETGDYDCWCRPRVEAVCPECDGIAAERSCWLCHGKRMVHCRRPDLYDGAHGLLIVHNEGRTDD